MEPGNQADETPVAGPSQEPGADPRLEPVAAPHVIAPGDLPLDPTGAAPAAGRGLMLWLVALALLGAGGVALGQPEMAALLAFAGLFVAAQAADFDARWVALDAALAWVAPLCGAVSFAMLGTDILHGDASPLARFAAAAFSFAAAAFAALTLAPAVARGLVAALFRTSDDSRTLRLAARLASFALLLAVPGALVFPEMIRALLERPGGLIGSQALGGELVGYVALALAGVGFLVRRDLRSSLARLGVRRPAPRDIGRIAAGAGALFVFNSGSEWLQQRWFAATWLHDHAVNLELTRGLSVPVALLLGITAGIGEELTLRGALQPRLGIVLTAAVFASLHVQYSWYGMLCILAIGVMLGVLRKRAGTSVAIAVHALYDVLAIFTG